MALAGGHLASAVEVHGRMSRWRVDDCNAGTEMRKAAVAALILLLIATRAHAQQSAGELAKA